MVADGIDLDIEEQQEAHNLQPIISGFCQEIEAVNPKLLITQPVYGYPQVTAENTMVNQGFTKNGGTNNLIDSVGIMVYNGLGSLQYVKDYGNGTSQWDGFPIQVECALW
eukprot:TRINITY_DN12290_c0_g1_i1.p1 TRINITY_DN12290_c0_g1~~TRINITY_DN12290_c0_g1_i1.p1  ORF type:complete len:110 (+),score=10.34 TRINITY_DN12290_c0_g1_i1:182-511(+)